MPYCTNSFHSLQNPKRQREMEAEEIKKLSRVME
jgi:hypothetical protein